MTPPPLPPPPSKNLDPPLLIQLLNPIFEHILTLFFKGEGAIKLICDKKIKISQVNGHLKLLVKTTTDFFLNEEKKIMTISVMIIFVIHVYHEIWRIFGKQIDL